MLSALILLILIVIVIVALIALVVMAAKRKTFHSHGVPGAPTGPKPGWYPDPEDPSCLRYFDGRSWTSSTQPRV